MKANPTKLPRVAVAVPGLAGSALRTGGGRRVPSIGVLCAALFLVLSAPNTADSKQLCDDPGGSSSCCKAWGGTWVTGGSGGFCYRNLRISSPADETACKASGGKVETKDGEKICLVPIVGGAPAE